MMLLEYKYTITEAIIWYGILLLAIILFFIYLKIHGHRNKGYNKIQMKLGREITRLEIMLKNIKDKKPNDNLKKTVFVLASVSLALNDIEEKTSLSDVKDALEIIDGVNKEIKKLCLSSKEQYVQDLEKIIESLNRLNSMFITIIQIIR